MRRILIALLSAMLFTVYADGKFIRLQTPDKLKDKDLTFAVTFDKHSVNADFAKGNKECISGKNTNLALRGTLGFDRAQGFTPLPGEQLVYYAVGNASPHNGTISLWINARDFNPAIDTKRGNMAVFTLRFTNGKQWINYILYEYKGCFWIDWKSSEPPHRWGDTCTLSMPGRENNLRQNEYFNLVYTWQNSNEVALFCNGKEIMRKRLPGKSVKTAKLKAGPQSRITLRPNILADSKKATLDIDDVKIYSRALTALEVANMYRKTLKNPAAGDDIRSFTVKLFGVDRGFGKDNDIMEAEFDLSGIPDKLLNKSVTMDYELTGPGNFRKSGSWKFNKISESRFISGIKTTGKYTITVRYGKEKVIQTITRPDLSFLNNRIGKDEIPELWKKDYKVNGRSVTLWNRVYTFKDAPFPVKITVGKENLLTKPPQLLINNKAVTDWKAGKTQTKPCSVIFTGSGKFSGGTINYTTEVWFDGLIDCRFEINGKPVVSDMRLKWQVAKPFTEFLMLPEVYEKITNPARFNLNYDADRAVQLWFVTPKKGGFCWSYENDANWIYKPADKILTANIKTGECNVRMINRKVTIPQGARYNALFMATPVRPLPKRIRNLRWGGGGKLDLLHGLTGCLTGPTNFDPHPTEFAKQMKRYKPGKFAINGLADSMTAADPEAVYFEKYCKTPGASNYNIPYRRLVNGKLVSKRYPTISTCNRSFVNDLFLWNIKKLLNHPYGDRIRMIYYDLCGNGRCSNELHGCTFKDKFGRKISSWSILNGRDLIIRTVTHSHANNRQVFLHGQRSYYPMLQGTADYWFPGEEHMSLMMRNPYGFTDEISDKIFRSEFNRDVRNLGCIVLPVVTTDVNKMRSTSSRRATEASFGMLLLYDVEFWNYQCNFSVYKKIADIKDKYRFEDAECFPFYSGSGVVSDEPDLLTTRYLCPDNVNLLVVMNKEPRSRTGTLDCSKFTKFSGKVKDVYSGTEFDAVNGKFKVKVPARSFRIIVIKK